MAILSVFIYHDNAAAKSEQMLREIRRALIKRLHQDVVFVSKPHDAHYTYGVYLSEDGKHRVLRRLGVATACTTQQRS